MAAESSVRDDTATGLWLYGVTDAAPAADGWTGVDGEHPVRAVHAAGLCALVSEVPLREFGPEALQEQLEDLQRVEELARAHEEVVERALADGPVVPFRLCTIYSSEAALTTMLEAERSRLAGALDRLRGAREWGVKAYLIRDASQAGSVASEARSGTDYLRRKRQARDEAERAREAILVVAEQLHAELSRWAIDAVVGRPQHPSLAGRDDEMLLNASYLVPDEQLDQFRATVAELAERHANAGVELELTGPWAPYHFADAGPES